jgi:hypothetical protein
LYEIYCSESCPFEWKKKKKEQNYGNYNFENKKLFKIFFRIFEKSDFFIIDHQHQKNDFDASVLLKQKDEENVDKNINQDIGGYDSKNGTKLQIDEKSSFFNKWISCLLQFLIEFDIQDEVFFK